MLDKKKKRPGKGDLTINQSYLKSWDDFQVNHKTKGPILLPIAIDIDDGIVKRARVKAGDVSVMREGLLSDFNAHCAEMTEDMGRGYSTDDFERMLDEYIEFFDADNTQSDRPPSPLDFSIVRPVWFMFYLPRESWTFTESRQFSIENDRDDCARNCEKVTTLDDNNILLLANHQRSNPKGLKYNLHVTISQIEDGRQMSTDIIIDPGMDNNDDDGESGTGGGTSGGPGGGGSSGGGPGGG